MNRGIRRGGYAYANLVTLDAEDGDLDGVTDSDGLPYTAGENEHDASLLAGGREFGLPARVTNGIDDARSLPQHGADLERLFASTHPAGDDCRLAELKADRRKGPWLLAGLTG